MLKFDFEEQRFRHNLELEEFKVRDKLEKVPLDVILSQMKFEQQLDKKKIFWITISPPPDYDLTTFINKVKSLNPETYQDLKYNIEQRGETVEELGKGFHLHMLCKQKKNQSQKNIINNLSSKFKLSNSSIDVKLYPVSYYNDKVDYLKGKKNDPDKDKKIRMDILFREKYSLNFI